MQSTWSQVDATNALVQEVERRKSLEKGSLDGEKVIRMATEGDANANNAIYIKNCWCTALNGNIF
ncbi:hypothetical protein ABLO26_06460 [Neobacillus sp. 179-J 1A1 HS]